MSDLMLEQKTLCGEDPTTVEESCDHLRLQTNVGVASSHSFRSKNVVM